MLTSEQSLRERYLPSGYISLPLLVPWAFLSLLASVMIALGLCVAFHLGFFLILLVPLIAAVGAACMVRIAIVKGHCRSPLVGTILGLACGLIVYLGYYHFSLVASGGIQYLYRIDVLPNYIVWRIQTDVVRSTHNPSSVPHQLSIVDVVFNAIFFLLELAISVAACTAVGRISSKKAFCERCGRWMKQRLMTFPAGSAASITKGLEEGRMTALTDLPFMSQGAPEAHTSISVEYCDNPERGIHPCPVYLSVKEVTKFGVNRASPHDLAWGKTKIEQLALSPQETAQLALRVSELAPLAGKTEGQIRQETEARIAKELKEEAGSPTDIVEAEAVPQPFAGRILTSKNMWKQLFLVTVDQLMLLVGFIAALGGIALVVYALDPQTRRQGGVWLIPGILLGLSGIVAAIAGGYLGLVYEGRRARRFQHRLAVAEISRRPDPWVDPRDPEAWFVEHVPRENWYKLKLNDAIDVGLLRVGYEDRVLLFEGDRYRYRIPAGAVRSVECETVTIQTGHGAVSYFRVVIKARHRSELHWELALAERQPEGKHSQRYRESRARKFAQALSDFLAEPSTRPAPER